MLCNLLARVLCLDEYEGSYQSCTNAHTYLDLYCSHLLKGMLYHIVPDMQERTFTSLNTHQFYLHLSSLTVYSKTCLKQPLKRRPKIGFQDRLSLNEGQKYCRMLQGEHSEILLTFIKLPFVIKTFVLSIFEWPL